MNSCGKSDGRNYQRDVQSYNRRSGVGYLIMDVERHLSGDVKNQIESLDTDIRTCLLF